MEQESLNGGQSTCSTETDLGMPLSSSQGTKRNCTKRQLPLWMLGVTGAESIEVSGKKENAQKSIKGEKSKEAGNLMKISGKTSEVSSSKRSKARGEAKDDGKASDNEDSTSTKANENTVEKRRTQANAVSGNRRSRKGDSRIKKKKQHCESDHMQNHMSRVDDDKMVGNGLDLTVEDLISMAKERIEAEENREFQGTGPRLEVQLEKSKKSTEKATSIFSNDKWRDLSHSLKVSESISSATENNSKDLYKDNIGREESSVSMIQNQRNAAPSELGMSDDIAQDMLDLLLGPALGLSQNSNRTSQLHLEETSCVPDTAEPDSATEQEAPLLKKKSSLRDKVTMLLN